MTKSTFDPNRQPSGHHRETSAPVPAFVKEVVQAPGRPLETPVRTRMEQRFGWDFSRVRIHDEPAAHDASQQLDADAWTMGSHIAFGAGRFQPHTPSGERLLRHELTHVVQQRVRPGAMRSRLVSGPADAAEHEAGSFSTHAANGPAMPTAAPAAAIHRQPAKSAARQPRLVVEWDAKAHVWRVLIVDVPRFGTVGVAEIPGAKDKRPDVRARFDRGAALVEIILPEGIKSGVTRANPGFLRSFPRAAELRVYEHGTYPQPDIAAPERKGPGEERPSARLDVPPYMHPEALPAPADPWDPGNLNGRELTAWERRMWPLGLYDPMLHPVTGAIIGYKKKTQDIGYHEIVDIEGKVVWASEVPLETPLLDPIDFIPSPGTIAKIGTAVGKKAIVGFILMTGIKAGGKKAAGAAGASLTRRLLSKLMDTFRRAFSRKAAGEIGEQAVEKTPGALSRLIGKMLTREAMKEFVEKLVAGNPILQRLIKAHGLSGQALQRELIAIIGAFENQTHVWMRRVAQGTLKDPKNASSMTKKAGQYWIEEQVFKDSAKLLGELCHEFAFYFARIEGKIPGLANGLNAADLLEMMLRNGGKFPL